MSETPAEEPAKKAPARKAPAKKAGAKKATRKAPAKKAAAKTPPAKEHQHDQDQHDQAEHGQAERGQEQQRDSGRSGSNGRPKASRVAAMAAAQLLDLTGKEPEGVIGLDRTEDGWRAEVEVLELRRIPATTDVLAAYEVTVDEDGDLVGYRRLHRYTRGSAGEDR